MIRAQWKVSTRLFLSLGFVFALAAAVTLLLVRDELKRQAISEAEAKAEIILDNEFAVFNFLSQELRPKLFKLTESYIPSSDYFDPTWMSSTYALHKIDGIFRDISKHDYFEKMCAVDARNPVNEADQYERDFIAELDRDSQLVMRSKQVEFDGQPFFVVMRRGFEMEESCLLCHGDPAGAPPGLIARYGSEHGFGKRLHRPESAISVRIPMKETYAEAEEFSLRLSGLFLTVLASVFLVQHLLQNRLLFRPLQKIHDKALQIADSDLHLGETIDRPRGKELVELTEAFNRMSNSLGIRVSERESAEEALQKAHAFLEKSVESRTAELSRAYQQLKLEVEEKNRVQDALRHERDFIESLVNTAQTIILVLDPEGRTVRFNPYLEQLSGYSLEEVRGKDWFDTFIAPANRSRTKQVFLEGGCNRRFKGFVNPMLTKDGRERQIEWYSEDLCRTDGSRIGILSVGQDITERKKAEEALKLSENRLRNLYSQLLTAQEEERREIAKEVHDSIGSHLAGLKIGLENALMRVEKKRIEPESLRALAELAQHAMRECRRIMTDLRPTVLDDYGIVATIGWFCDRFQAVNPGIHIGKELLVDEAEVPESLRIVLFRIVQEALNNAARHSGAANITVSLLRREGLELCIRDDGCGFDLVPVPARKTFEDGIGITNMQERTELSGGSFRIETTPGAGTSVVAHWSL